MIRLVSWLNAIFLFVAISAPLLRASDVIPDSVMIRSRSLANGNRVVEFCEDGVCKPFGYDKGYSAQEWKEIESFCGFLGYMTGPIQVASEALTLGALATGNIVAIGLAVGVGAAADSFQGEGYSTVSDSLPALNTGNNHHQLGFDDFVRLEHGLKKCTQRYDQLVEYGCALATAYRNNAFAP